MITDDREDRLGYVSDSEVDEEETKSDADPCAVVRVVAGDQSLIPISCYPRWSPESQKRTEEFIANFILPQKKDSVNGFSAYSINSCCLIDAAFVQRTTQLMPFVTKHVCYALSLLICQVLFFVCAGHVAFNM
ncbi:unnamed protein product [Cuscuta europaea]|uniref:Uncharacterized protein n=1 Tax=Cuscuta europaea TaxID=41803 RepID=A0A9P0ZD50_CUSEU|nr:unnamed protein product [Cuscuta europaea]